MVCQRGRFLSRTATFFFLMSPAAMSDTDSLDPEAESLINISWVNYIIASIRRYFVLIVIVAVVGMCLGALLSLTAPNQYRSVGKLLVRPGVRETTTPESAFSGTDAGAIRNSVQQVIENEMQVLAAPQLFEKVVEQLGVSKLLAPYNPLELDEGDLPWHITQTHAFQSWWFRSVSSLDSEKVALPPLKLAEMMLAATVSIKPELGTNVISFTYESHSAELAQSVVDAALSAAIELHRDVFNRFSTLRAIQSEFSTAEKSARVSEKLLLEFRKANGIYNHELQRNKLLADLGALSAELTTFDTSIEAKRAEIAALKDLLTKVSPERLVSGASSTILNPDHSSLTGFLLQLLQLDLSLDAERKDISPGEFETRKTRLAKMIADTSTRLQQEGLQLVLERGSEDNPYFFETKQSIDSREVEVQGLLKQAEKLQENYKVIVAELAVFESLLPDLSELQLDATQKRAIASRLAEGVASMRTVERLEQLNLSNIQVMHPATFEPLKIGPQRGKLVAVAGLFAAVLGTLLALLLAWRDPRVRNYHDLVMLGVPSSGLRISSSLQHKRLPSKDVIDALPRQFHDISSDIASFWAALPYDHRATEGLKIGFVPCGENPNVDLAAATLAIGLAAYGGEQVLYVSCSGDDNWLAKRLGLEQQLGWSEVLKGQCEIDQAVTATSISGLSYLPMGSLTNTVPHPLAGPSLIALLDQVSFGYRFVIVAMPAISVRPEVQSLLSIVDAVEIVVSTRKTRKDAVRETLAAITVGGSRMIGAVLQKGSRALNR